MATVYNDAAVSNGSRREISDRTRRPGAWRIGGWGLRRRTRNGEYQLRGFLATDIPNHCRRMKSFSESSTGRISRAWHIRGTLPEGRTHDGKYQLGHNVPTDIPLRFRLFWARETRSHFRRGFYFARLRALGRRGTEAGMPARAQIATGNIDWSIMDQSIFRTIVGGGTALRNH